jgi:hypothetical protein
MHLNRMKKIICILIVVLFLTAPGVNACKCSYGGSFVKMAAKTGLVALVKIVKFQSGVKINTGRDTVMPLSMEVEIIETYKGNESRKTVTVWGDNGMLCRPCLNNFAEGKYYLIAFDAANFRGETEGDYSISICGCYWLTVDFNKQTATGDIDSPDERIDTTMALALVKNKISNNIYEQKK